MVENLGKGMWTHQTWGGGGGILKETAGRPCEWDLLVVLGCRAPGDILGGGQNTILWNADPVSFSGACAEVKEDSFRGPLPSHEGASLGTWQWGRESTMLAGAWSPVICSETTAQPPSASCRSGARVLPQGWHGGSCKNFAKSIDQAALWPFPRSRLWHLGPLTGGVVRAASFETPYVSHLSGPCALDPSVPLPPMPPLARAFLERRFLCIGVGMRRG